MMKKLALLSLPACWMLLAADPALASEGGSSMLESFVIRSICFAVFLAILIIFLRKPIKRALAGRRESIQKEMAALEEEKEITARQKAEAEELLRQAEAASVSLLTEYRQQAEMERSRILREAAQQIERMHEQAKLTIAREIHLAQEKLKKELALAAVEQAEEMVRQQITLQDQEKLNQAFIEDLPQSLGPRKN
jgi:F-type H+-transporting ATPase subunit b